MKFKIIFITSVLTILLASSKVVHAEEPADPCPSNLNHIVADMCTEDSVIEDNVDGSKSVDSVLLRITKQLNNCVCHVSLQSNRNKYTIYMSKYNGLSTSSPAQQYCGLAIDVDYEDTTNTSRTPQPIECSSGTSLRSIALGGNDLKLKSRIIDGDFNRGYCMQIYRNQAIYKCSMIDQANRAGSDDDWVIINGTQHHSSVDECKKYCMQTDDCVAVWYEYSGNYCFVSNRTTQVLDKDGSIYSQKHCVDTQKLKIQCYPPEFTTQTNQVITQEDNISTKSITVSTPSSNNAMTNYNTQSSDERKTEIIKEKGNSSLPVIVVAVVGWCLTAIFAITTFCLYRRRYTAPPIIDRELNATNQYEDLSASRLSSNYNSLNIPTVKI